MFKKVIKNISVLSVGTFVSLSLGFLRDILVANFFGTSAILEAFIAAFRFPNLFRSIFGEGFADSVATPVLSEQKNDKDKLFAIGNNLLSLFTVVLVVFSLLGTIFSKYLIICLVPGYLSSPDKFNMAVSFTRLTFFYLFFIGLSVNSLAILSVLKKFYAAAITPSFLNISFIVGILFFSRFFKNYILVVCVLVAGVLQLVFPLISLCREGFRFKFKFKEAFKDKEIARMFKLFVPRVGASIIYQLNVIIDTIFSSLSRIVGEGALAAIWFANRLVHFPVSLIALSIARVAIVDLAYFHKENDYKSFKDLFVFSFQNLIFFIIPIAVIYIFLSREIIDVMFRRGEFNIDSLAVTSSVLFFYAFGLFFFCAVQLLVVSFYSLKDTATPAKINLIALILNVVFSAILMYPLKIGGVALGSSLSGFLNFFILLHFLKKKIGPIDWKDTKLLLIRVLSLSLAVGIICRFLWEVVSWQRYQKTLFIGAAGLVVFILGGDMLGLKQVKYIRQVIKDNIKRIKRRK